MSRRDKLSGIFAETTRELAAANFSDTPQNGEKDRVLAGPVRTMGLALDRIDQESRELQAALQSGDTVVELDPDIVDGSFIRDRLDGDVSETDDLVQSIHENGQEVPILVRQHPEIGGRYQVAYGHRRLRAMRILGRKVRAVIRPLTNEQLVVAQGIENTARRDLSYIERAMFALSLENKEFSRDVIMQALNTDKTELSKLLSVARSVPRDIVQAIGAAPSTGRRKWMELAEKLADQKLSAVARKEAQSPKFESMGSDERFMLIILRVSRKSKTATAVAEWKTKDGKVAATIKDAGKAYTLSLRANGAEGFGTYLSGRLDEIYADWQAKGTKE